MITFLIKDSQTKSNKKPTEVNRSLGKKRALTESKVHQKSKFTSDVENAAMLDKQRNTERAMEPNDEAAMIEKPKVLQDEWFNCQRAELFFEQEMRNLRRRKNYIEKRRCRADCRCSEFAIFSYQRQQITWKNQPWVSWKRLGKKNATLSNDLGAQSVVCMRLSETGLDIGQGCRREQEYIDELVYASSVSGRTKRMGAVVSRSITRTGETLLLDKKTRDKQVDYGDIGSAHIRTSRALADVYESFQEQNIINNNRIAI
ncbi:unnamed protein product, partial [Mesorhabditis belari]|uniref:Uncharacterized protein n=1 Tax=Mesorhabditis belari TaxID=2138241 RepID=A0AAF3EWQ6_9BILA